MTDAHQAFPQSDRAETVEDILASMLTEARWEAAQNLTDTLIDVPILAGAQHVERWGEEASGLSARRLAIFCQKRRDR